MTEPFSSVAGEGFPGQLTPGSPGGILPGGPPPGNVVTVTNPGSQTGTVGTSASVSITATDSAIGQTLTYTATGLPPGESINGSTGAITGTPTAAGSFTVTVTATDTTGAFGSATFTWTIAASGGGNVVTVTNPGNQTGLVGTPVSLAIIASDSALGQTLTYTATGLPPGVSINPVTGLITGTPTTAGTFNPTVTATDTTSAAGSAGFIWTVVAVATFTPQLLVQASVYGEIPYGTSLYGELGIPAVPSYLAEPFIARSLSYTSIGVSWSKPTATAARWRLLTNRYGYPVDQNDGSIVIDTVTYPGNFYLDTSVIPGAYHYYGLYALVDPDTNQWQRAGVTACLATKSFNTGQWLLDNLPAYFTENLDGELTTDAAGNPFLTQFLAVFGWGIDYVKTQAAMAANHLNDPMAIPIGDLMNLATELGITFDPMIAVYLMRKAARNWAHVMQERGTPGGVASELELTTGFGVDLQYSPNLMLEQDQSEFTDPVYPAYDPSIAYALGERVGFGNYWYACAIAGTKGTTPTGTSSSNANWNAIIDSDEPTGLLANPVTGGVNTWEVIYPAASNGAPLANSLEEGIGVPNPLNSAQLNFNDIRVRNGAGGTNDIIARSVSRTTTDMSTVTTTWAPDPLQAIHDGIPVPWVLPTQGWDPDVRYGTNDIVSYNGLPFMARRASTGAVPPVSLVATPEWYPLSPSIRLPLMASAYTSQSLATGTNFAVPVTPFVEWYDAWGNFITRVYARTPTPGTPGIPDNLAFDSFTQAPGPTIAGRDFDNAYVHDWVAQDSDFHISGYSGGVAYPSVPGVRAMALTTGPANGQVGATFVTPALGGQAQAIVFRYTDESDYWKATTGALVKKVSGTFTTMATYSTPAQPGDRLVVQMNGSAITVLLNGISVATVTDGFNASATSHGMLVE